jgi:two-component system, LytTR family, response regulator
LPESISAKINVGQTYGVISKRTALSLSKGSYCYQTVCHCEADDCLFLPKRNSGVKIQRIFVRASAQKKTGLMQPLKALIVEDNAFMATVLHDLLKQYAADIAVLDVANTGDKALRLIASKKPNVVFLDIELPDMTGFELLQQLDDIPFQTIFTTAHSHYAIRAFRFNALDYLVKPVKESELDEAIKRLLKTASNGMEVKHALSNLEAQSVENQKLVLSTQNRTLRLPLKQITHIEGERNYSYIYLSNGSRELSSKNLAYFEDILMDKNFFRNHRSFLVNRYHIEALKNDHFVLKNGIDIPISRRNKTAANEWFFNAK